MAVSQLIALFRQCLLQRISANEFLKMLQSQVISDGKSIFKTLLSFRQSFCIAGDTLPALYLESLAVSGLITLSDVLIVVIVRWNRSSGDRKLCQLSDAEILSLQELTMLLMSSKLVLKSSETKQCLLLSSQLVTAMAQSMARDSTQTAATTGSRTIEATGSILATICATDTGIQLLSERSNDDLSLKKKQSDVMGSVKQAVELSISLFPSISMQLMDRLGAVQKHISMFASTEDQEQSVQQSDMHALQFQAGINEVQMVASRAGTFSYLEDLLNKAVTIDDTTVLNFMAGRHNNDYHSMLLDMLLSSFQLLKLDPVSPRAGFYFQQYTIFVLNKLPLILSGILASSFGSFSSEDALTNGWSQIQAGLTSDNLMAIGHRFLYLCSLHQLISPDTALHLIGGETPKQVARTLYSKEELVAQFSSNHSKVIKIIEELKELDGNAASICQATVEIMHAYCQAKETHHLKDLTNTIAKNPTMINTLALFIRPAYWLGPMCTLLDEWRWQEIHGESQPVYDEFGSIFLCVLLAQRRLALSKSDLGIRNPEGFVARYLDQEGSDKTIGELSEEMQQHLGDWINALYVAEGLSDDLTTTCSPHEFYMLIPTLLRQSLIARQSEKLEADALKAGLEYLLEPFLLPSLMSGISWITRTFHEDPSTCALMLSIFTKAPGSIEGKDIHRTILSIMSTTIYSARIPPEQINLSPNFAESGSYSSHLEVRPTKNILFNLQKVVVDRISSTANRESLPALFRQSLELEGPLTILDCLIAVFLQFSGSNSFLITLDVVATIICVADISVRNALRLKYNRLGTLLKSNSLMAEAVVHLHRRVEAYASVLSVPDMGMDQFGTLQLGNMDTTNADLNNANNIQSEEMTGQDPMDDIDQVLDEAAAMGNIDQGDAGMSLDDLYGLQNDNMGLGNLDDLDLDMF